MKKTKGGKRSGSGRKKTGRTTEVISFSVPKELVEEIKGMVKIRLNKKAKMNQFRDLVELGVTVSKTTEKGIERVDPLNEQGLIVQMIAAYEIELSTVPEIGLGIKRRRFLQSKISELKRQLK